MTASKQTQKPPGRLLFSFSFSFTQEITCHTHRMEHCIRSGIPLSFPPSLTGRLGRRRWCVYNVRYVRLRGFDITLGFFFFSREIDAWSGGI